MPIFSNRRIHLMISELPQVLSTDRINDISVRLAIGGDDAIAAEWEIAVIYCLSKVGKVSEIPTEEGVGNPDLLFEAPTTGEKAIVEITAVSDKAAHDKNPVDDFFKTVDKLTEARGINKFGAFDFRIGHIEDNSGVQLAIPSKRDLDKFSKDKRLIEFLDKIKQNPDKETSLEIEFQNAKTTLTFVPGKLFTTGGYRSYRGLPALTKNVIANRLEKKRQQIKRSKSTLPAIIFLCDNDCQALRSVFHSPNEIRIEKVIDLFLNGQPHKQLGRLVIQKGLAAKTQRINGVFLFSTHINNGTWATQNRKFINVRYISANSRSYHQISDSMLELIISSFSFMPKITRLPENAKSPRKFPDLYGGYTMSSKSIKFSLLTLQKFMAGEISPDVFFAEHKELQDQFKRNTVSGRAISNIKIEKLIDEDDDWVTFEFNDTLPDFLFNSIKCPGKN